MKVKVMLVREGRAQPGLSLSTPALAYMFLRPKARRLDREYFWRIDLDIRQNLIGYEVVSVGTLSASLVAPREFWKGALLANAASSIAGHNHPSGIAEPSPEDREATRRLQRSGALLGIPLLDHIVVGHGQYFSFREKGLL